MLQRTTPALKTCQPCFLDWDFATRLALVGNPMTTAAVLASLTTDPQPCVSAAATARVRRGTPTIEPIMGEILDPGEIVWLLVAYPRVFFHFGVTTWGDGSPAYEYWFAARLREDPRWRKAIGHISAWGYAEGLFYNHEPGDERGYRISHLALHGLGEYACGHLPSVYLGIEWWIREAEDCITKFLEGRRPIQARYNKLQETAGWRN